MSKSIALACIGVLLATVPRWLPYESLYFIGQSAGYLTLLLAIRSQAKVKGAAIVADALVALALNNIMDELFFDPITFGWNEGLFVFVVIAVTLKRLWIRTK